MPLRTLNQVLFDFRDLNQRVYSYTPVPGGTGLTGQGITLTATGTATAYAVANTSRLTMNPVVECLVTTASTTAVAGFRTNYLFTMRSSAGGAGGFYLRIRWRPATGQTITTHRAFVGLRGSNTAPTDVNPSTLTNIVGMGWDAADANVQIMHNDGTGTATKIDLGSNFPRPNADRSNLYDLELYAAPGSSTIEYRVVNVLTGAEASGTLSTDLPVSTQLLAVLGYASVGGTSSVIGIGVGSIFMVTYV